MTDDLVGAQPLHLGVLVIGWGKGGKTFAATLGGQGTRVGVIEQFDKMHGATCINIGCVPTKMLAHSAAIPWSRPRRSPISRRCRVPR